MSYWIDESDKVGSRRQLSFFIDSDDDVSSLPTSSSPGIQQENDNISYLCCGKGSVALSIESGKVFMLDSSDQWREVGNG